jgi:hypothetical protein
MSATLSGDIDEEVVDKGWTPWVRPDLHGLTRFVAGKEDEHEEHNKHDEQDTQIEGKHTHTRYTPVVLIGPIHQLNRITRKRLKSRIPCGRLTCKG